MEERIVAAKNDLDSVGGVIECMVTGLPAGLGDPFSILSKAVSVT